MYAIALTNQMFGQHLDLLNAMYRLRRRVFKERLDWTVSVSGDVELDVYDILSPTYLLVMTGAGKVAGSVRLLPTTGANMLADTFAILLGGEQPPCSERILESSRFCVDTELVFALNEQAPRRSSRSPTPVWSASCAAPGGHLRASRSRNGSGRPWR